MQKQIVFNTFMFKRLPDMAIFKPENAFTK